jgi:hypothetical protein
VAILNPLVRALELVGHEVCITTIRGQDVRFSGAVLQVHSSVSGWTSPVTQSLRVFRRSGRGATALVAPPSARKYCPVAVSRRDDGIKTVRRFRNNLGVVPAARCTVCQRDELHALGVSAVIAVVAVPDEAVDHNDPVQLRLGRPVSRTRPHSRLLF